ncbi:MAG: cyclic pyranopterin monophosphate synthase MoaC [Thermodesulfobacteriota bacterium]|nr:cyclic pyranopterin monophosphate synthase MoaC [Thermodesulfobacteriota bacterium]
MADFTHLDKNGRVQMVDVGGKADTQRTAVARGTVKMSAEPFDALKNGDVKKGNVLETARIAGIMAAKKTSDLVPMCHPLNISHAGIDFSLDPENRVITIEACVRTTGKTGVEMEAITAVSVAAITIYDMCKSYDKSMVISDIRLIEKTGGKSGVFRLQ